MWLRRVGHGDLNFITVNVTNKTFIKNCVKDVQDFFTSFTRCVDIVRESVPCISKAYICAVENISNYFFLNKIFLVYAYGYFIFIL